jgi:hypothetical protein
MSRRRYPLLPKFSMIATIVYFAGTYFPGRSRGR